MIYHIWLALGCLYASMATYLNITFATNKQSQINSNPSLSHYTALQCVLHYLIQTRDYQLILRGEFHSTLISYTDSNYAGCTDTR